MADILIVEDENVYCKSKFPEIVRFFPHPQTGESYCDNLGVLARH